MGSETEEEMAFLIKDEMREGVFANIFKVYRKADDIVPDFGRNVPDRDEVEVKARVVMTVESAKALMTLIKDFVAKKPPKTFEEQLFLI